MKYVAIFLNIFALMLWVAACSSDGDEASDEMGTEELEGEGDVSEEPLPAEGDSGYDALPDATDDGMGADVGADDGMDPYGSGMEGDAATDPMATDPMATDPMADPMATDPMADPGTDTGMMPEDPAAADGTGMDGEGFDDSGAMGGESTEMGDVGADPGFGDASAGAGGIPTENVYFDTAKADITPAAQATIDAVVAALQADPSISLTITGYCDHRGRTDYNQALSQRRADAVKDAIIASLPADFDASRLTTIGGGELAEGELSENRRVEFMAQ